MSAMSKREIIVVSHSSLFYWWPVWTVCFLFAGITYFAGSRVVLVPDDVQLFTVDTLEWAAANGRPMAAYDVDVIIAKEHSMRLTPVHISHSKNLGVLFVLTLLLTIFITNVPLRGLWSVVAVIVIVSLVIILGLLGVTDALLRGLGFLDIRISAGGYVVMGVVLLALWIVTMFFFDRQIYMVFTPGSMRHRQAIGEAETAYDTTGMVIQKQRNDFFRHWVLGLGSGDLVVRTRDGVHFDMPNVLFLGRRVKEIERLVKERVVIQG